MTGLSPENVELGLRECLEIAPGEEELRELCSNVKAAPAAHVLLSANVFVATHRALAIAFAASERVSVRASRREPEMVDLLQRAGVPFERVHRLSPQPGDHVWAYGSDSTLSRLGAALPEGVVLHAHGSGIGVALVEAGSVGELRDAARALASDVVPFDQRGCLSPRVALVSGDADQVQAFAWELLTALEALGLRVPVGRFSDDERAEIARYRDAAAYALELRTAGDAAVSLDRETDGPVLLPPIGRNVHVARTSDVALALTPLLPLVAALGVCGGAAFEARGAALVPAARVSALGRMQRPRFDGPVDRRPGLRAHGR